MIILDCYILFVYNTHTTALLKQVFVELAISPVIAI